MSHGRNNYSNSNRNSFFRQHWQSNHQQRWRRHNSNQHIFLITQQHYIYRWRHVPILSSWIIGILTHIYRPSRRPIGHCQNPTAATFTSFIGQYTGSQNKKGSATRHLWVTTTDYFFWPSLKKNSHSSDRRQYIATDTDTDTMPSPSPSSSCRFRRYVYWKDKKKKKEKKRKINKGNNNIITERE